MNENEFNNAIITYYEALFFQVMKVPDNILNNSENVIRWNILYFYYFYYYIKIKRLNIILIILLFNKY